MDRGARRTQTDPTEQLLLKIDNGPYHTLPVSDAKPKDKPVLDQLTSKGFLRLVPDSPRMPAHYVLTSKGSHYIGTFRMMAARRVLARFLARD